jgi:RND superfamily putative drug exporter
MGLGGMLVALVAMAAALIALPAALALLGSRVNALSPGFLRRRADSAARPAERGFWFRLAQVVMRRPATVVVVTAGLLLALGSPFLDIRFTTVDARVLPASASGYQVNEIVRAEFPRSLNPPLYAAIDTGAAAEGAEERVTAWAAAVRRLPNVADVSAPAEVGPGVWRVDVGTEGYGTDEPAERLVHDVRALPTADPVLLGGRAAFLVDQKRSLGERLPWAALLVVLTTLVVLFAMTGSLLLPVKAVLLNLLTISAVFGVLVLIFQHGHLEGLLGFTSPGAIDTTQPLMIAAIAFGLSTDYGVFLLSRIKEARDAGASDRDAVAFGLERTGRIVTAAALLFVVAIGAFATSRIVQIKEIGIGTALAVAIDATIVRALLVPSLMRLLGRWNWWAPAPLARLHARLGLAERS